MRSTTRWRRSRGVLRAPKSLTHNQPRRALDPFASKVTSTFAAIATEVGEPFVSLFVTDEIDALLQNHGFGEIVHFGAREARDVYFNGRDHVEIAGAQRLAAATLARV